MWVADLAEAPASQRVITALNQEMVSGWAVPVRAGSKVLAVLEFYCHFRLREDREAMAAVETAAASLGQMLARTQERGRADELSRQQEILLDAVADGICGLDRQGKVTLRQSRGRAAAGRARRCSDRQTGARTAAWRGCRRPRLRRGLPVAQRRNAIRRRQRRNEHLSRRRQLLPGRVCADAYPRAGPFFGSVLSFRDISQRYALDRMKDEFISTVSHELRTPLTSIRGALGLLTSGILGEANEKATNLLRIALTNSDRLVRLINDILDLERIQSGREPLAFRTVQLADIVKQAIEDMQPMADAAGVQLIHDATKVEITADSDRLLQVITNLLSNAVKFSPPNSPVSVMLRPGVTGVILSVIDHGRGIPADKLETIFGRFQQVDASDSRQKGGTGLGLAICRTIVLQHSGRIWAERNPVRGSTFRIFLPYQPAPVAAPGGDWSWKPATAPWCWPTPTRKRARGSPRNWPAMATPWCRPPPWSKPCRRRASDPQAILLDTSLDGMNGWEILPLLRRMDASARTPVVLLSVEDPESSKRAARRRRRMGCQAAPGRCAAGRAGARALRIGRKGAHPHRRGRSRPGARDQRGLCPRQHLRANGAFAAGDDQSLLGFPAAPDGARYRAARRRRLQRGGLAAPARRSGPPAAGGLLRPRALAGPAPPAHPRPHLFPRQDPRAAAAA